MEATPQLKMNTKSNEGKEGNLTCLLTTSLEPGIFTRVMTVVGLSQPLMCVLSTKLGHLKNVTNNYFSDEQKIVTTCQFSL